MSRKTLPLASILMLSLVVALAGYCRADDQQQKDPGAAKDLPEAVLQAALFHVPDLTVDDVSVRQVKGHPTVFVIDGQCCDRGVVLAIEENGDVHEIRFHKYPGLKPAKISHATDDMPDAVRTTAERVIPDIDINDVKSSQAEDEQRVYHLIGTVTEGEDEHYVTLTIEEDGGLLEARVIKPLKQVASIDEINAAPERDPNDD